MTNTAPFSTSNAGTKPRPVLTTAVWTLSLTSLIAAGLVATALVFMASSLEPADIVSSGVEAWTDALKACAGFLVVLCISVLELRLWHSRRFSALGLALTLAQVFVTGWACVMIYQDYV